MMLNPLKTSIQCLQFAVFYVEGAPGLKWMMYNSKIICKAVFHSKFAPVTSGYSCKKYTLQRNEYEFEHWQCILNLLSCNTPAQTLLKSIINSLWKKLFLKLHCRSCKEPRTKDFSKSLRRKKKAAFAFNVVYHGTELTWYSTCHGHHLHWHSDKRRKKFKWGDKYEKYSKLLQLSSPLCKHYCKNVYIADTMLRVIQC